MKGNGNYLVAGFRPLLISASLDGIHHPSDMLNVS